MRLNEFIEITNDLDPLFKIFFKEKETNNIKSVISLKLTNEAGYFLTGKNSPQTLLKLFKIINKINKKKISLKIVSGKQIKEFYGLQIDYQHNCIYLR